MINYGKLEFINIDKNGKCCSEKLHFILVRQLTTM